VLKSDVVIVGCGPVGALLANLLGSRGVRTLVLEKEHQVHQLPRALGFDDEVKRVFQAANLDTSFGRSAIALKGMDLIKPCGKLLRRFDIQKEPQLLGHPLVTTFHQPALEVVIRNGLDRYSDAVDLRLGATVETISDLGDSVEVEFRSEDSQDSETVQAKFLVGCDGSRSFVRNRFDIEMEDMGLHQPWLVVDVIMKKRIDMNLWAQQICDSRRPATFIPSPPPRNRFEFMLVGGDEPETMTRPERARELIRPWLAPDEYEIERAALYTFHALLAKQWRRNRILIAGDAAHQMPPFLGQGMCAGIRDVFNLAWKLDLIISGHSDLELLDSYGSERKKHVRYVIQTAVRVGKIIQAPNRAIAMIRNAAMRMTEFLGYDIRHMSMSQEPLGPGFFSESAVVPKKFRRPFPQPYVSDRQNGQQVLMDTFLGDRFTLLTRLGNCDQNLHPLIKLVQIHGPDAALDPDSTATEIYDVDGVVTNWLEELDADAVLLRPDRVPFGVYSGASAALPIVAQDLQRHLAMPSSQFAESMSH